MKGKPRIFNFLLVFVVLFGALGAMPRPVEAAAADLFISEYIEGSSYNKAVEIYNGTGSAVDLSAYTLELYSNGADSPSQSTALTGTLADGDVYVLAHGSADPLILAVADVTNNSVINFNGDDAIALRKNGELVDVVGQIGVDPGSQWGSDLTSTADNTLRRKSEICQGDPDGSDAFDPALEWDGFALDTFDGLGEHTALCDDGASEPVINEFSASTTGTDVEYVEIYGDVATDYSAYVVLEIEGDGTGAGVIDEVIEIGTTDGNGLYLINLPSDALENGTVSFLLVKDFTGELGNDLDTNDDGIFETEPWTAIVDAVAVNDGGVDDRTYGAPVLGKNYDGLSSYAPGGASRIPDGYDTDAVTDWVRNDFDLGGIEGYPGSLVVGEAYNTPGAPNAVYTEAAAEPVINEFSASTTGTDVEYVEIYGDPGTDYSAYKVLEIEGDSDSATGMIDEVISLGTTDANGLYLASLPANALENGTITLLLVKDFAGASGVDLDTNEDGILDVTPWSAVVDAVAVNDGGASDFTYGTPVLTVSYDGLAYAPGGASRIPDGFDTDAATDWVRNDFDLAGIPGFEGSIVEGEAYNTPGAPNAVYTEAAAEPVINEFSASTTGTDVEYVEIFGDPDTDYSAYKVLEIEGDSNSAIGGVDEVIAIGTTDPNGLYLAALPANALENGTISLLLVKDFTGSAGVDIDINNDGVIDDPSPWAKLVDSVAVNDGGTGDVTYGATVLVANYDGLPFAPGGASRIPDGYDTDAVTDWVRNDFDLAGIQGFEGTISEGEAYNTPGALNMVYTPPPEACGDPFTPIYEIQGSGMTTPIYGTEVATEGIVVGDFQTGGKNGYYIQALVGDGDPATSDGIFVYAPDTLDVSMGDHVRVKGYASEYYDLTQVSSVSQVWVCDTGLPLPTPIELSLPVASVDDFEPFEGMYVTFPQNLVISEYFDFDRYGEIVLTSTRHLTPTALVEPGPDAIAAAQEYLLDRITLDDGITYQNPDPAIHPNGMEFTLDNLFRGGDMVANVTGVLDYSYDLYRIQPTQGADYIPVNPRPTAPSLMEGDLKVASMNVLNYFTTIDTGADICSPSGDMECRGADDTTELARQRAKILTALSTMNADVVGLIEIENDRPGPDPDYAAADLVAGLNEMLGAGTYDYIATGAIGTDAIKVALIYKLGKVTPVGEFAVLDSTIDPRFLDDYNRPVLAQSFMDNWSEEVFTVAVNHLKSKGSECDAVGDYDLGDGAGNCNLTRLAAAQAEVDWLATDPTGSGFNNIIIIGDLNSYDKEDPIDAIKAGPDDMLGNEDDYFDLLYTFRGEDAYSYVFDGQIGYLDYALANFNFEKYIDDVQAWHINADEPDLIDYDTSYKEDAQDAIYAPDAYRSSDHDPVIVTFTFDYINVLVDILPGSCENPLNVKAGGVLPVVIPGTADFDVTLIDPTTLTLADISPVHWAFEDTSTAYDCSLESGDGYLDLVLLFDVQEIVTALGEVSDGDVLTLKFHGRLLPEFGGIPVLGEDFVLIIKKGK